MDASQSHPQIVAMPQMQSSIRAMVIRFVLMCVGFALTMSAFGIWLVGQAGDAPSVLLMKLGVSLFMLIAGMCLVVIAKDSR